MWPGSRRSIHGQGKGDPSGVTTLASPATAAGASAQRAGELAPVLAGALEFPHPIALVVSCAGAHDETCTPRARRADGPRRPAAFAAALLVLLLPPVAHAAAPVGLRPAGCAALQGFAIPASAIGLPSGGAVVQAAVAVAADAKATRTATYCQVTGLVKPRDPKSPSMQFEVNLPLAWNAARAAVRRRRLRWHARDGLGAFVMQPADVPSALAAGLCDARQRWWAPGGAGFDGRFGLDDEALLNYGRQSVKKTHDVAVAIVRKAYGRRPERFYFIGGSQGGHEALDAAARYPQDYDGVVAHYPAYNVTLLHLGSLNAGKALYENGGAALDEPGEDEAHRGRGVRGVRRPRRREGRHHREVAACNATFDVATLRCAERSGHGR